MSQGLGLESTAAATRHRVLPRRRPRRTLLAAACVAGGALALPFGAGSPAVATIGMTAAVPATDSASDPVSLLELAYKRSQVGYYHGVQLVMIDSSTHLVGVSHIPGHTYLYAVTVGATGQAYETTDTAAAASSANPLSKDPLALLMAHYLLSDAGTDVVYDRPAHVIEAMTQAGRLAAKFWVDDATSLLIQRETFDANGNIYSKVTYTSLEPDQSDPALRTVTATALQPQGIAENPGALDQLHARGWWAKAELPGSLTLYDARELTSATGTVLHLSYSDGISTVSVFEQRGRLAGGAGGQLPAGWRSVSMPDGRRVVQADGVPVRAAWQAHDLVVAVIADVPQGAMASVIDALPYGAAPARHGMVVGRVSRGLGRIAHVLNPFG